jgi:hypothetical protein
MVQTVGVDILVVFLALAGVVLLSGASLAAVLRATGNGLVDTSRILRARAVALERASREIFDERASQVTQGVSGRAPGEPVHPPEPASAELIVRATHVEAPSVDGVSLGIGEVDPWDADLDEAAEPADSHHENDPQSNMDEHDGSFAAVDLRRRENDAAGEATPAEPSRR